MSAHIQMNSVDNHGNTTEMFPLTTAEDVSVDTSNDNLPQGVVDLQDIIDNLGALAFEDSVSVPKATTTAYGVVKSATSISDEASVDVVPTLSLIKSVNEGAVHTTAAESISGVKTFEDGIVVGNVSISYNSSTQTLTFDELSA